MPQLDFATFPPQLIWLAVTFIVLYIVLSTAALPAIGNIIEARRARIDADLDRAAALKDEAAEALDQYEKALASAHEAARAELRKVAEELAAEAARRHAELAAKLTVQMKDSEARIAAAKDQALAGIGAAAGEAAAAATERLISRRVDRKHIEEAVEAVRRERV